MTPYSKKIITVRITSQSEHIYQDVHCWLQADSMGDIDATIEMPLYIEPYCVRDDINIALWDEKIIGRLNEVNYITAPELILK